MTTEIPSASTLVSDQPGTATILRSAWAVLRKDLQTELRTRYAINSLLLFAAGATVAVSLGAGGIAMRRTPDTALTQAALLWIALLFAALNGLARSFLREEETRTAIALRLSTHPGAIYLGKLGFNLILLIGLSLLTSLLFIIFVRLQIIDFALFSAVLLSGALCLAGATTLLAALVTKTDMQQTLFAVLAFPLLMPPLIAAIQGTAPTLTGINTGDALAVVVFLLAYAVATITGSLLLFRSVWEA